MRLRSALRGLAFLAIGAGICFLLNFTLTDDIHSYTRVMMQELYADAGNVKTLFLGASHCYRSFDPALTDRLLDTVSFNAGSSQQLPDGSYYLLTEAEGENPLDTVYLECFFTGYGQAASRDIPLACYLLTDYMHPSLNKLSYLWEMGGAAALVDALLPARHSVVTPSKLPEVLKAKLTDGYAAGNYRYVTYPGEEEYRGQGFVYTYGTPPYGFGAVAAVNAEQPISPFGLRYLDKMTESCAEKGIRLVLVTAPLPSAFAANTPNYQTYIDAMAAYAAQNGLQYWDFTLYRDTAALDLSEQDYSDAHHLNGQGAEKFTRVFCSVAKQAAAGEPVSDLFYGTLQDKLATAPDATYLPAN